MAFVLVTNDIDPYYRDAIAVLALWPGMRYRFRYERPLVGEDIVDAEHLAGADGLILFRQRTTGKLAPLRRINIDRVTSTNYFVFIEFTATDFPDVSRTAEFACLESHVIGRVAESNEDGFMRPLIYEAPEELVLGVCGAPVDAAADAVVSLDRWRAVIDNIANFEHMAKTCFLNLYSIKEDRREVSRGRMRDGMLAIYPQASYDLGIASYAFPPAPCTDAKDAIPEFALATKADAARISAVRDTRTSLINSQGEGKLRCWGCSGCFASGDAGTMGTQRGTVGRGGTGAAATAA